MDLNKFTQYEDEEAKLLSSQKKKKIRKRRSGKKNITTIFIVLILASIYFVSDLSNVKSIQVKGNDYYFDKDICEIMGISYDTKYLLTFASFLYENNFVQDPLIKKVDMKTKLDGTLTIEIEEKQVIGYYLDTKTNKLNLLLEDGSSKEIDQKHEEQIVKYAYIEGFNQKELKKLADAFTNGKEKVKAEIIDMISEIRPYSESYDQNMVKIVMQDGNTFYISFVTIPQLNYYSSVLKDLKDDNVCFVMIPNTDTISTEDCSAFK